MLCEQKESEKNAREIAATMERMERQENEVSMYTIFFLTGGHLLCAVMLGRVFFFSFWTINW